jgi:hypothetical protein
LLNVFGGYVKFQSVCLSREVTEKEKATSFDVALKSVE